MSKIDDLAQRLAEAVARDEAAEHQRRIIERIDQTAADMGFAAQAHCVPSVYLVECGEPCCRMCPER